MLYAINPEGGKVRAAKHITATCPGCAEKLRPKCGEIIIWHWAHAANSNCPLSEGETSWHIDWKSQALPEHCEVRVGSRRADVFVNGCAVEFQHSSISPEEIRAREKDYRKMIWVFDGTDAYASDRLYLLRRDGFFSFKWKHGRKTIASCRALTFIDLGFRLLFLRKIYIDNGVAGWGRLMERERFIRSWLTPRKFPNLNVSHNAARVSFAKWIANSPQRVSS
jgi:Competence protein CoiA-like family